MIMPHLLRIRFLTIVTIINVLLILLTGCSSVVSVSKREPLMVITFDDSKESDYELAYPLLKSKGVVGTSYIIASKIGKEKYLNWDQIREMKENGWGIECHSFDHARLNELTDTEIEDQFRLVDKAFENNGLEKPKHHAFPFGAFDERVIKIGLKYRKTLRNIQSKSKADYNKYDLKEITLLNARNADFFEDRIDRLYGRKDDIDRVVENCGILVLYAHTLVEGNAVEYQTQIEYFEEVIDYAIEKGMIFVTVDEMYKRVEGHEK